MLSRVLRAVPPPFLPMSRVMPPLSIPSPHISGPLRAPMAPSDCKLYSPSPSLLMHIIFIGDNARSKHGGVSLYLSDCLVGCNH